MLAPPREHSGSSPGGVFAASSESEQTGCHVRVRGLAPRVIVVPVPGLKPQCPYTALLLSYMNPAI